MLRELLNTVKNDLLMAVDDPKFNELLEFSRKNGYGPYILPKALIEHYFTTMQFAVDDNAYKKTYRVPATWEIKTWFESGYGG